MVDNICILKNLLQATSQVSGRLSPLMNFRRYRRRRVEAKLWKLFLTFAWSHLGDIRECETGDTSCSGHLGRNFRVRRSSVVLSGREDASHPDRPALVQPTGCCQI